MNGRAERGMALVLVLGLVAIISAWAATAAYRDMIAVRRAENAQDWLQAWQTAVSGWMLARHVLREDARMGTRDDLQEAWARPAPPLPVGHGQVVGRIVDAERFLNLNDLVDERGRVRVAEYRRLQRVFTTLGLDPALVDALADWMDADDLPYGPGGAEQAAYADQPYRVKNAPLDDWQELLLVRGFDAKVLHRLARVACVAPSPAGGTPVNVNTAAAEVLMALFPAMRQEDAARVIAGRPYDDLSALRAQPWSSSGDWGRLRVRSELFFVRVEADVGRARVRQEYLVRRRQDRIELLDRRPDWSVS